MFEEEDFIQCSIHKECQKKWIRVKRDDKNESVSENISTQKDRNISVESLSSELVPFECVYCLQNEEECVQYEQFVYGLARKYDQIQKLENLVKDTQFQISLKCLKKKYKEKQEESLQIINSQIIFPMREREQENRSLSKGTRHATQQLVSLFNKKVHLNFSEKDQSYFSRSFNRILTGFSHLIKFVVTTPLFKYPSSYKFDLKKVKQYKLTKRRIDQAHQNPQHQIYNRISIKSNIIKLQNRYFICGDNKGYLYVFDWNTKVSHPIHSHISQISVVEKVTEDIFASCCLRGFVTAYKIEQNQKTGLPIFNKLSELQMEYQTFRMKSISNTLIAINQSTSIYILDISKPVMQVVTILQSNEESEIYGIMVLQNRVLGLHRTGKLIIWNWETKKQINTLKLFKKKQGFDIIDSVHMTKEEEEEEEEVVDDDDDDDDDTKQLQNSGVNGLKSVVNQVIEGNINEENDPFQNMGEEIFYGDHNQNEEIPENQMGLDQQNGNEEEMEQQENSDEEGSEGEDEEDDDENEFNLNQYFFRIRKISENEFAVANSKHEILIFDMRDSTQEKKPILIKEEFDILCLEKIMGTDLLLVGGIQLKIYDLKKRKLILAMSMKNLTRKQMKIVFGKSGLIGGSVLHQKYIVSMKQNEYKIIFIKIQDKLKDILIPTKYIDED